MRALERRRRGEDDVGVARGLVDVDVERDHEVQRLQRALQAAGVRRRQRGVAGQGDERAHLALAGRVDLLGQAGHRQLAVGLAEAAHAARPAPDLYAAPASVRRSRARCRAPAAARVNIAPPAPVEVAGEHVEHVDQPRGERPELLRAGADAPVHGRPVGGGELARHRAGSRSASIPQIGATASGVNGSASAGRSSRPVARARPVGPGSARPSDRSVWTMANSSSASVPGRMKWCSEASSAVRERRGSMTTTLPPRSMMPRSRPRMSGAVSSDPLEASGLAPRISRCVAAVHVRHRHAQHAAEHQARRDLLGHLVHRRGGVDVPRAQRLEQHAAVDHGVEVVRVGIAQVDGDGVAVAVGEHAREPLVDRRQRLVPGRGRKLAAGVAHERRAQPVGILGQRASARWPWGRGSRARGRPPRRRGSASRHRRRA